MSSISRYFGLMIVLAFSATAFASSSLDGTKWRIEMTPSGMTIPQHVDQVTFKEEKLNTVIFQRRGFSPTSYNVTENPDGTKALTAVQSSDVEGELDWNGEIKGEALTGNLLWKKKDGTVVTYALVGAPSVEEPTPEDAAATAKKGKGCGGCSLVR